MHSHSVIETRQSLNTFRFIVYHQWSSKDTHIEQDKHTFTKPNLQGKTPYNLPFELVQAYTYKQASTQNVGVVASLICTSHCCLCVGPVLLGIYLYVHMFMKSANPKVCFIALTTHPPQQPSAHNPHSPP